MKSFALYEVASGIVTGTISADIVPTPADGYAYTEYDPTTDPRGFRVASGKIVKDSFVVPVETLDQLQTRLLAAVDVERERLQMTVLTDGGAKKYVYNRKAMEAIDGRTITVSLLNGLGLSDKKKRFPFATTESFLTGETLSAVLVRFDTGMNAAASENARIEAVAQKAKRDIRAAATIAAKRAAYAAINWNWSA
jgi:hypothetical protein